MSGPLHFDCLFYYVTDLDRAVAFYTQVLGLTLSSRDVVARLHLDGVLIELVPTADARLIGGTGNARLTFAARDIHRASQQLQAHGVSVSPVHRVQNGSLATFHDPDGNELVLWQYAEA
jgi:predicted enzyme related to lactoylglutathione lyase